MDMVSHTDSLVAISPSHKAARSAADKGEHSVRQIMVNMKGQHGEKKEREEDRNRVCEHYKIIEDHF